MNKTRYLALNIQKEISIKYYKADTEETVNKLFFKEYGKYPQKIINVSEYAKICLAGIISAIIVLAIEELSKSKLKIDNNNLKLDNNNLKIDNNNLKLDIKTLNDKLNKTSSDGTRHRSSICAKTLVEKRWSKTTCNAI